MTTKVSAREMRRHVRDNEHNLALQSLWRKNTRGYDPYVVAEYVCERDGFFVSFLVTLLLWWVAYFAVPYLMPSFQITTSSRVLSQFLRDIESKMAFNLFFLPTLLFMFLGLGRMFWINRKYPKYTLSSWDSKDNYLLYYRQFLEWASKSACDCRDLSGNELRAIAFNILVAVAMRKLEAEAKYRDNQDGGASYTDPLEAEIVKKAKVLQKLGLFDGNRGPVFDEARKRRAQGRSAQA